MRGCVSQIKDPKTKKAIPGVYRLRVDLGTDPITGKRSVKSRYFHGTRDDAESELTRMLSAVQQGGRPRPDDSEPVPLEVAR